MEACILCSSSEQDELKFGKTFKDNDITVHLYCLLFAPGLSQRGKDSEGIQGFLIEDIKEEAKRVRYLRCFYCSKNHSNIGCAIASCPRSYHIDCGGKNFASFEFAHSFPSYCGKHVQFQQKEQPKYKDTCGICLTGVGRKKSILIPCCKNSWFHQHCLQKFANTAGSWFKCPLCNDKKVCYEELPRLGIFLPTKDADWEFDASAFDVVIDEADKICDSDSCKMPNQPFNESPWLWKICSICGSSAAHKSCMEPSQAAELVCKSCTCTLKEIEIRKIEEEIEDEKVEDCKSEEPVAEEDSTDDSDEEEPEEPVEKISLSYISWMSDEELAPEIELRNKKVDQQKRKRKLASPEKQITRELRQRRSTRHFTRHMELRNGSRKF